MVHDNQVPAWPCRGHGLHDHCHVGPGAWVAHLCLLWWLPFDMDGVLICCAH
uniref:Uncharacterized protein n=1 Tax=Arundo donax TaxID=35708 RepID=A0A0A8ZHU9_ARUDO